MIVKDDVVGICVVNCFVVYLWLIIFCFIYLFVKGIRELVLLLLYGFMVIMYCNIIFINVLLEFLFG